MTPRSTRSATATPTPGRLEARVLEVATADGPPLVVLDATTVLPGRRRPAGGSRRDPAHGGRPAVDGAGGARGSAARSSTSSSRPTTASCRRAGDRVAVDLEWARRYALMRTHTALHALCGVVWRDYGALVTGGNMEPGSGRMDFEFETMSGDLVGAIEAKVNAELQAGRDVRVNVLPRAEAFAIPDLIRTKVNLLPRGDRADPHDRDRRPRPPGRRRDARGQHPRGRRHPGDRLRVEGPHQQAHPDRARRARLTVEGGRRDRGARPDIE